MSGSCAEILRNRKRKIDHRLAPMNWDDQEQPMFSASNIHYEIAEKTEAICFGGIGAIHKMVGKLGLPAAIDRVLHFFKKHLPYHESDHVLNMAYNALLGGKRLQDIEIRRNDIGFLNAMGAQRIQDPTTSGDFTRRFSEDEIISLMECINTVREKVWRLKKKYLRNEMIVDIDGTIAKTYGECKGGMDISYKGIWGYCPLIISLANTREVLYLVNRSGNVVSHDGAAEWIDRAIALVKRHTRKVLLRGDTDFSLTTHFDRWAKDVDFIFGMDASETLVSLAKNLPQNEWEEHVRPAKYQVKTNERRRPENVKEQVVIKRNFKNYKLRSEQVAEFLYQPGKCAREYRVVALRKNITVMKGADALRDEIRYFFYITTKMKMSAHKLVLFANQRCDQENVIEQLKNGVNAMRMPVNNTTSNWAYMVMTSLAWNLKAWFAMLMPEKARWQEVLRMEFRGFYNISFSGRARSFAQGEKLSIGS